MARKLLKCDLARQLDISASMVSRLSKQGMPTHSADAARAWRDTHLAPSLRKEWRFGPARSARADPAAPAPVAGLDADAIAGLLLDAGEAIAASLLFEVGLPVEKLGVTINSIAFCLCGELEARGGDGGNLFMIDGPDLSDPAVRARVDARVAKLRAELGEPDDVGAAK